MRKKQYIKPTSTWNRLVAVINNQRTSKPNKEHAQMLLNQINTAAGSRVIPEAEIFLNSIK